MTSDYQYQRIVASVKHSDFSAFSICTIGDCSSTLLQLLPELKLTVALDF